MVIREIQSKSILSKSSLPVADYAVNPYLGCAHACRYCYASFMKRFSNHPEPWGSFVDVKSWPPLKHPEKYRGKNVFIGSVTDPYQPAEAHFGRTRRLLEELKGSGCRLSIATKSDLILRDLDLIKTFPGARISWSINTLDPLFQKQMDRAVSIERRMAAMRAFHAAGVHATCFISPIFPGITNPREIIDATKDCCSLVWLENLNLRGSFKYDILHYIQKRYPALLPLYKQIYLQGDRSFWHQLDAEIRLFAEKYGLPYLYNKDQELDQCEKQPAIVNYFFHEQLVASPRTR